MGSLSQFSFSGGLFLRFLTPHVDDIFDVGDIVGGEDDAVAVVNVLLEHASFEDFHG